MLHRICLREICLFTGAVFCLLTLKVVCMSSVSLYLRLFTYVGAWLLALRAVCWCGELPERGSDSLFIVRAGRLPRGTYFGVGMNTNVRPQM